MTITRRELPSAPVPIRIVTEPEPELESEPAAELTAATSPAPVYVPPTVKREPLVAWSCRMPLRLRDMLAEVADNYHTDMTSIVVDLLEIHLPKIPRKKR